MGRSSTGVEARTGGRWGRGKDRRTGEDDRGVEARTITLITLMTLIRGGRSTAHAVIAVSNRHGEGEGKGKEKVDL